MDIATQTYFEKLNNELKNYSRAIPSLLLDLDVLDKNLVTLQSDLKPTTHCRIVVKSLPSFELLDYIMKRVETERLMVFHQPFLSDLVSKLSSKADVLLGKPMPIKTAEYFYTNLPTSKVDFNAFTQVQWLVDTEKRIEEYVQLAKKLRQKLRLHLEIDVGLHRGGFTSLKGLEQALLLFEKCKDCIEFSGFMGYDPHVVKLPKIIRSQEKAFALANNFYTECKELVRTKFPALWNDRLIFNGGGSPTLPLHSSDSSPLNDIAIGSCLVKPTNFDIPSLKNYQPASFIATPILKKFEKTTIPALEKVKNWLPIFNKKNQQSYFIYGGFWKADYFYPKGLQQNNLFGASTNQTMINSVKNAQLNVDDFVFLRPNQSEFVFLHFGGILTVRDERVGEKWGLLRNS